MIQLGGVHLYQRRRGHVRGGQVGQVHSRGRGGLHGGHHRGGRFVERHVLDPGVVPVVFGGAEQEALLPRLPGLEEGLAVVGLPVGQGLGEGVVPRLGQQEDADDADEGAAGEDDVVKEVALLIVKVHDGACQHPETSAGQDQAQTAASAMTNVA